MTNQDLQDLVDWADANDISPDTLPRDPQMLREITGLDFGECGLSDLPDSIGHIVHLQESNIFGNQPAALPNSMGNPENLPELNVENNPLAALPDSIGHNQPAALPDSIANISNLQESKIDHNRFAAPPDIIKNPGKK